MAPPVPELVHDLPLEPPPLSAMDEALLGPDDNDLRRILMEVRARQFHGERVKKPYTFVFPNGATITAFRSGTRSLFVYLRVWIGRVQHILVARQM